MKNYRALFPLDQMAQVLGVSRSGYYDFLKRKPSKRDLENKETLKKIRSIFEESHETYGSPRIYAELSDQGTTCSRRKVARLMKKEGIQAKMYKKFVKTTKHLENNTRPTQDLVQQNFYSPLPNKVWVADITFIAINRTWAYLAVILDLFSRKIVGMALSNHMRSSLVLAALHQALLLRRPSSGLIHHSDLGSQYTSHDFYNVAQTHGIKLSYGKTGSAYDNSAMESFFHTLKTEHVYFKSYKTLEESKTDIFEYIFTFYNSKRRHSTLNYQSPNQWERNYYNNQTVSVHSV
ncbi:MAG: IS3 family transposase [Holosporales bacterium]|nr:IS3 family transposase [Holosporales bacterium]